MCYPLYSCCVVDVITRYLAPPYSVVFYIYNNTYINYIYNIIIRIYIIILYLCSYVVVLYVNILSISCS